MGMFSRPIHAILPTETIIEILDVLFTSGGGLADAVRLSGVDKVIRDIVTSCPTYWTSLLLDMHPASVKVAQLCIERSQKLPLTLHVALVAATDLPAHMGGIIRIIVTSAPRLTSLDIRMKTSDQRTVLCSALARLHTPKLGSLLLDYDTYWHAGESDRASYFPKAPRLKSLTLNGIIPMLLKAEPFAGLTSLRLGSASLVAWPSQVLAGILRHAILLEELHFEGRDNELITSTDQDWTGVHLHCPNLRTLSIIHADEPFLKEVFKTLRAPLLETVKFLRPVKGTRHRQIHMYGFSSIEMASVRNLIIYHNPQIVGTGGDSFVMYLLMTFPKITSLEVGTANAENILRSWAKFKSTPPIKWWTCLQTLKVYGTKDGQKSSTPGRAVLDFLEERKQYSDCWRIENMVLDASGFGEGSEADDMIDTLLEEVETVLIGDVAMTPWK